MDKTKRELVQQIEQQKEQLGKYETKLKDVVRAYKGLLKEKEALETALKVSSDNSSGLYSGKINEDVDRINISDLEEPDTSSLDTHPLALRSVENVQQQITSLASSLSTITSEKSRVEAAFQADKKKLLQEKEELEKKLKEVESNHSIQLEELQSRLIIEKHDRQEEQHNQALMMRELQNVISEERKTKEDYQIQLQECKIRLSQQESATLHRDTYEGSIKDLQNEIESLRSRIRKAKQPEEMLLELQKEMNSLKRQHVLDIQEEQIRVLNAEERAKHLASMHEERVASLEFRLAELSDMVGNYDRLRMQDQAAIQTLKDQLSHLDRATSYSSDEKYSSDDVKEDLNQDVQTLMDRITWLKGLLRQANERSEKPQDIEAFLIEHGLASDHSGCVIRYQQLKDEMEFIQSQKENVKIIDNKEESTMQDVISLNCENQSMRERIKLLQNHVEDLQTEHNRKQEQWTKDMSVLKESHKYVLLCLETEYRGKSLELEQQLKRQRDRSLALLEEKDQEIRLLKRSTGTHSHVAVTGSPHVRNEVEDVADTLSQLGTLKGEAQILHCVHEMARKDVEISSLHKTKHQLETDVRQLITSLRIKEENFSEEVEALRTEISRLNRNSSREGANLEYLKNVVLRYMLSSDISSRRHMLNAISAILQFTCEELESVKKYNALWWWQSTPRNSSIS